MRIEILSGEREFVLTSVKYVKYVKYLRSGRVLAQDLIEEKHKILLQYTI